MRLPSWGLPPPVRKRVVGAGRLRRCERLLGGMPHLFSDILFCTPLEGVRVLLRYSSPRCAGPVVFREVWAPTSSQLTAGFSAGLSRFFLLHHMPNVLVPSTVRSRVLLMSCMTVVVPLQCGREFAHAMHGRSRITRDPRIPTMPGAEPVRFSPTRRQALLAPGAKRREVVGESHEG